MLKKQCCICEVEKPATEEYFHHRKGSIDGFRCDCKLCRVAKKKKDYNRETKKCSSCNKILPNNSEFFHRHRGKYARTRSVCKTCHKQKQYEAHVLKQYGITIQQFNDLVDKQHSKCAICGRVEKLVVDHNHETKTVRGLLCNNCNRGLGFFQDNVNILTTATKYLNDNLQNPAYSNRQVLEFTPHME